MVYPKLVQGVIFYRENERLLLDKNGWQKKAFSLSVNVFSTKVLTGDTIFTSPTGEGTAILRGHPSHAKVRPAACRAKGVPSFSSVILRPWVLVRSRESNPGTPALQSSALPTELILPRLETNRCMWKLNKGQQLWEPVPKVSVLESVDCRIRKTWP